MDLAVYDAGTDSGAGFVSADIDTQPAEPISLLSTASEETDFVAGRNAAGAYLARFTFERLP